MKLIDLPIEILEIIVAELSEGDLRDLSQVSHEYQCVFGSNRFRYIRRLAQMDQSHLHELIKCTPPHVLVNRLRCNLNNNSYASDLLQSVIMAAIDTNALQLIRLLWSEMNNNPIWSAEQEMFVEHMIVRHRNKMLFDTYFARKLNSFYLSYACLVHNWTLVKSLTLHQSTLRHDHLADAMYTLVRQGNCRMMRLLISKGARPDANLLSWAPNQRIVRLLKLHTH